MSKKKICVYAICKNEINRIDKWVDAIKDEADDIVVLDTGSTDGSYEKLQSYWPLVKSEKYDYFSKLGYFRFDKARNDSLKLVPYDADICVVIDLDQIPRPGWGDIIRSHFEEGYTEVMGDIIDHSSNGEELNKWRSRNVHPNSPFWVWDKIIHEGIEFYGKPEDNKVIYDSNFIIDHYPEESKDRSLYRKLLEYACETYPDNAYYGIYLGIELSRRYSKEEAAKAFQRCINECKFTDKDTDLLYQCYINLAAMYVSLGKNEEAIKTVQDINDISDFKSRRSYKILADAYEALGEYDNAINALKSALEEVQSYSNDWRDDDDLFNGYIEDRLSLFYYYKKNNPIESIKYCALALEKDPNNSRLVGNMEFYYSSLRDSVYQKKRQNDKKGE